MNEYFFRDFLFQFLFKQSLRGRDDDKSYALRSGILKRDTGVETTREFRRVKNRGTVTESSHHGQDVP